MRILRDGRIEVGFSEDGRLTALFEEGNQNKNKCSVKNAALVGYHQKFCGGSYLCGIRNCCFSGVYWYNIGSISG